jgi:hypothetical protein
MKCALLLVTSASLIFSQQPQSDQYAKASRLLWTSPYYSPLPVSQNHNYNQGVNHKNKGDNDQQSSYYFTPNKAISSMPTQSQVNSI